MISRGLHAYMLLTWLTWRGTWYSKALLWKHQVLYCSGQSSFVRNKRQSLEKELEIESRLHLWGVTKRTVKEKGICRKAEMGTRQKGNMEHMKLIKKMSETFLSFPT